MARYPTPKIGTMLNCEDGEALVVDPATTTQLSALIEMLRLQSRERFSPTNPVILAASFDVRIEPWFAFLQKQADEIGQENFWGPDGQGMRSITVAYYPGDLEELIHRVVPHHRFEPGLDVDMEREGRSPDPSWCNVCGESREAGHDH